MIKVTKEKMNDEQDGKYYYTEFVKVEESDGKMAVFFEGDYHCFYTHLMSVGVDKATAMELRETYKQILQ